MFQNFNGKNFRCFKSLLLKPLARVNLIAGKNNTGKTALLEAIRLHCDPTDSLLPTKMNEERGIEDLTGVYEELWAWYFLDRNRTHWLELRSQDDKGTMRTVRMRLTDVATARAGSDGVPESPANFPGQGWHGNSPCLVVKYEGPRGDERIVWIIGPRGEAWYTPKEGWRTPCELIGAGLPSADRDVRLFSALETENRLGELLPSLQILEPRLDKLSLAVLGQKPVIHGSVGLSRLVPIALMGEGVGRLLSVLLAIVHVRKGVVLIDEIENGLHYSVHAEVWRAIAEAARQNDVQVFATTHSWECVKAAHQVFTSAKEYDFALHRLERTDGEIRVVNYNQRTLATSVEMNMEVR